MKKLLLILPFTLLAAESNTTNEDASILYLKNGCTSCHGIYGEGIGASPRLQGQREEVLLKRLRALQKGESRTPFGGVMVSFAQSLDENQTIEMAKYLSTLKPNDQIERYDQPYSPFGDGSS